MIVHVIVKNPSNLHRQVKSCPMSLPSDPHTLRELISVCVEACVTAYGERAQASQNPAPLSDEDYIAMENLGKFAFGVHYNDRKINLPKAIDTALQAFEDGLVRIFHDEEELSELDEPLTLPEGATLTFIRLTFLTGRMW